MIPARPLPAPHVRPSAVEHAPPCPCCKGTGSGLYNVVSWSSSCESCDGTGERRRGADVAPALTAFEATPRGH